MNAAVAAYKVTVEDLARQFVGRNTAEIDDLVQEGLIHCWQSLERGVAPSADMIENRMRDYVKYLGFLQGKGSKNPIPYEVLLPLEIPAGEGVSLGDISAAKADAAGE
jgi:hypothetical protein